MTSISWFGCCTKTPFVLSAEKRSKGSKDHCRQSPKKRLGDDFWSSSACDIDNSTVPSQRSASSIGNSSNALDCSTSNANNQSEFVNHGLLLWNRIRQEWVGSRESRKCEQAEEQQPKVISVNATYDNLMTTNKPFPRPIPLPEMVDFLVDVWEQEGLYD